MQDEVNWEEADGVKWKDGSRFRISKRAVIVIYNKENVEQGS